MRVGDKADLLIPEKAKVSPTVSFFQVLKACTSEGMLINGCFWNLLVSESNTYSSGQRRKPISTGKIGKLMGYS